MPRQYRSAKRTEQRLATRAAMLDAASSLFIERGYHGTTINAVADAAGTSAETVYATFGSKRELLREVARVAATGGPQQMLDNAWFDAVLEEPNQRRRWELMRSGTSGVLRRARPLDAVIRAAAVSDAGVAELWTEMEAERRADAVVLVRLLAEVGPLRVPIEEAADLVWGLSRSTGLYESLAVDREWPDARAFAAVSDAIEQAILLPPSDADPPVSRA